jgi:hypothetical protein
VCSAGSSHSPRLLPLLLLLLQLLFLPWLLGALLDLLLLLRQLLAQLLLLLRRRWQWRQLLLRRRELLGLQALWTGASCPAQHSLLSAAGVSGHSCCQECCYVCIPCLLCCLLCCCDSVCLQPPSPGVQHYLSTVKVECVTKLRCAC